MHAPRQVLAGLARYGVGVPLVSWRYLWSTVPLHRSTAPGDYGDAPPAAPPEHLADPGGQLLAGGTGPLYHRVFGVDIDDARLRADQLVGMLAADLNSAVPSEAAAVELPAHRHRALHSGDRITFRIPGPWNGPVRVLHRDSNSFRLGTLAGHMEAGQIEFRAHDRNAGLRFEIEVWARSANRVVDLLYRHLWVGSEIQVNMWIRFCLSAARLAGGKPRDGVTITTRVVGEPRALARCLQAERAVERRHR